MNRNLVGASMLLLRLATGLVFIPHGYSKIFGEGGPATFAADMPQFGIPAFLGYVAAYAEFFGGILLLLGLLTRIHAALLSIEMLTALAVLHIPEARFIEGEGASRILATIKELELPMMLAAAAATIALLGAGRVSLDALLRIDERIARVLSRNPLAAAVIEQR
ncbi:MAG TPA: DoxX family protein [Thermoanaerobaculia bacterium]